MLNIEIAWIFYEMADLLEIKGDNFFKIRAYRNAAKIISRLDKPVKELLQRGELTEIPGIGKTISAKIKEILETGSCQSHQKLLREIPKGVLEIRSLPGIGPKKAKLLYEKLGIVSIDQLEAAAREHKIRKLPGMSARFEFDILRSINVLRQSNERVILGVARELTADLIDYISAIPGVERVEAGGGVRRWKETVSDIDLVVAAQNIDSVMDGIAAYPHISKTLERQEKRLRVLNMWGVEIDISVVEPEKFITTWHRNTGSKAHYRHLTKIAEQKGWKLSHQGLIDQNGDMLEVQSEADIYNYLNMEYIPPELREDKGEIEVAQTGQLPHLVSLADIKGDLHTHTTWSDAGATLEEMVERAKEKGYSYLAITDHSPSLKIANGLSYERLQQQCKLIEKLNEEQDDFRILTGVECDILADGRLDHPDDVLADLDVVVASVHTAFKQDKERMTNRIISAIEHEHVDIIGHVSGRLLSRRSGYELDMERVLEAAAKYDTILEINSSPDRLDLSEENARLAREFGVKLAINTDAHDLKRLDEIEYGVSVARRAWLSPQDVVNTLEVEDLLKSLK